MKKIAVIGIGLIGGSLLKALRKFDYHLIAVSHTQSTTDKISSKKLADEASCDLNIVKEADIVFVCTPMNVITNTLSLLNSIVSKDCIVTDAGSLKQFVLEFADSESLNYKFIGGHPMAGTENKGIDSAVDGLFEGAKWVLIPSKNALKKDFEIIKNLVENIGAKVVKTDAKSHDKAVALISHAPMILSQALLGAVEQDEASDLAFTLASSGFRDMTRLAMSNSEMAQDMFRNNFDNITQCIENVCKYFQGLNSDNYKETIEILAAKRKTMYSSEGKNVFKGKAGR